MTIQDAARTRLVNEMDALIDAHSWQEAARSFSRTIANIAGRLPARVGIAGIPHLMKAQASDVACTGHAPQLAVEAGETGVTKAGRHFPRIDHGVGNVLPCADVYWFDGDGIPEWRVYSHVQAIGS
ncbi:MAG: hypothetical protein ROR55_21570 [Devosia sp.]